MLDLFRFISLRPPQQPDPGAVVQIAPSSALQKQLGRASDSAALARQARSLLSDGTGVIKDANNLAYGKQYLQFATALDASAAAPSGASINQLVNQIFGLRPKDLIATAGWKADRTAIGDTLILAKLASDGTTADVGGLNVALRATTIIQATDPNSAPPNIHPVFALEVLPLTLPTTAAAMRLAQKKQVVIPAGGVQVDDPAAASGNDPGTGSLQPLPSGPSSVVAPVGIGDLLVVKQRLKRYEGADVAYIENVLRSESFKRDTRRVQKTQVTVMTETDVTQEEERDTQTTDRFSLQRESANTVKEDSSLKAGVAVSASYGPTVSVKANLDVATNSSQEDSTKVATSYSKDVTSRAASKITTTTKQQQTMLTSDEYDEDLHHGFDNSAGAQNISGVYQWVNKVYEAQVYNYGVRMMFDVMVPEPAAFLISQLHAQSNSNLPPLPPPFTTLPGQIDDGADATNYQAVAEPYGTTSLDPPPDEFVTVALEIAFDSLDPTKETSKSGEMKVPDGYQADSVTAAIDYSIDSQSPDDGIVVSVGAAILRKVTNSTSMQAEVGAVPVTVFTIGTKAFTVGIELKCKRTDRAFHSWQEKVHASIMQDYQRLQDAYQKAVSDAATSQGVTIPGQNPDINLVWTQNELKKACITLVTGQQYESFGAVELSTPEGYPEVLLANVVSQGKYIRFLEEAFEWENMTYFFYPYYWGRKSRWPLHALATDPDPQFSQFLDAGSARVVFPVRPGFNEAVLHLLETGQIWDGGDVPTINSPMYVSIISEIQAQEGAPGTETAQGDPWEITLPTTLVKLRQDDKLPSWGWDKSNPPQWTESP